MKIRLIGADRPNDFFRVILPQGVSPGKMLYATNFIILQKLFHTQEDMYLEFIPVLNHMKFSRHTYLRFSMPSQNQTD